MYRLLLLSFLCLWSGTGAAQVAFTSSCSNQSFCTDIRSCVDGAVYIVGAAETACARGSRVDISHRIDLFADGTIDVVNGGDTINRRMPLGRHIVYWRAVDACIRSITCSYEIVVRDCNPPNLSCISGITRNLEGNCEATYTARQFISNVMDNCTPRGEIQVGIRLKDGKTTFPTDSILTVGICESGFQRVEIWVRDKAGQTTFCNNHILVQIGEAAKDCKCRNSAGIDFNGCVRSSNNRPVFNTRLRYLLNVRPDTGQVRTQSVSSSLTTDSCYAHIFKDLPLRARLELNITGQRSDSPLNGFNTLDLALISRHTLALTPFTSFYQVVAADINRSGGLTNSDIIDGRKVLLGLVDSFPNNPSWRFIRPLVNTDPNLESWGRIQDNYRLEYQNTSGDTLSPNLDLIALKIGDVDFSADLRNVSPRAAEPVLHLTSPSRAVKAGETVAVPFFARINQPVIGWQMALRIDPEQAELLHVEGIDQEHYRWQSDGWLRMLRDDGADKIYDNNTPLFILHLTARKATTIARMIEQAADAPLDAEIYVKDNNHFRASPLQWQAGTEVQHSPITVFPPTPNPFSTRPLWNIELLEAAPLHLEVFNSLGQSFFSLQQDYSAGYHTLEVPESVFGAPGIYFYALKIAGHVVSSGRIIKA
jgi:hypothetical protein